MKDGKGGVDGDGRFGAVLGFLLVCERGRVRFVRRIVIIFEMVYEAIFGIIRAVLGLVMAVTTFLMVFV